MPNSACLEVNLPGTKLGTVCPRAVWEQTLPAKTALVCSSSVASTVCSRHTRPLVTPFTGDSSWHFVYSQGAVGRGDYLSMFSGCRLCWQLRWNGRYHGLTSTTSLHAGNGGQAGGGELCLSLPVREHTMDSPAQTHNRHNCSVSRPKARLQPPLSFRAHKRFLKYNQINVLCKVNAFVCMFYCFNIGCLACKHARR